MPQQEGTGRWWKGKSFNSRVYSMQFHDGRKQRWPGYPRATWPDIFNVSALHVCISEGSDHPILEIGRIWISRPHTSYVWNDGPIYIQISAVTMCRSPEWYPVNQGPTIKKLKSSFRPLLRALLPTSHSEQITPMSYSELPFCLTVSLTNFKRKTRDWYEAEN